MDKNVGLNPCVRLKLGPNLKIMLDLPLVIFNFNYVFKLLDLGLQLSFTFFSFSAQFYSPFKTLFCNVYKKNSRRKKKMADNPDHISLPPPLPPFNVGSHCCMVFLCDSVIIERGPGERMFIVRSQFHRAA